MPTTNLPHPTFEPRGAVVQAGKSGGIPRPSQIQESETSRQLRWVIVVGFVLLTARILNVAVTYKPNEIPKRPERSRAMLSANDRSRWCTVRSLVEQKTFQIDDIAAQRGWNTIDKVYKDGHYYSSKPPFLSVLVAAAYWPCYRIIGWDLLNENLFLVRSLLILYQGIPLLIGWLLMARIIDQEARTEFAKQFSVLALVYGSFLTTFGITLNNHVPAACGLMFAIWNVWQILNDDGGGRGANYFWGGFWCAFTACCELPAALMVALIGLWMLCRSGKRTILYFVPGVVLPLGFFVLTNYLATGSWKPFYTGFGTELYNYTVNGKPSYWTNPQGIDRSQDSFPVYLFHCLLGHHGLISLTPVTLLTIWSWRRGSAGASSGLKLLNQVSLAATVIVLAFYMTRTESYNYGGMTCGLRWMFWLIPLWILGMLPTLDRYASHAGFRIFSGICLAVSVFSVHWEGTNPWRHPWIFVWLEQWGWISYK